MIAIEPGTISAAATPCKPRATIIPVGLIAKAQPNELTTNRIIPKPKPRAVPKRSPNAPPTKISEVSANR